MVWIEKVKVFIIGSIFSVLFVIVFMEIVLTALWPKANLKNTFLSYFIRNVSIQTVLPEEYELGERKPLHQKYTDRVEQIEKILENFCTVSFPERDGVNRYVTDFKQKIYHYNIEGIMSTYENIMYVQEAVQNVQEFSIEMESRSIPFIYVQTPLKWSIDYYLRKDVADDQIVDTERSYTFMTMLQEQGVESINIARDYGDNIRFDFTNHWFPEAALKCSCLIATKLNKEYGFGIDLNCYDRSSYRDYLEIYPEVKSEIKNTYGYDYEILVPLRDGNYRLLHDSQELASGEFSQTFFNEMDNWDIQRPYHGIFRMENSSIYVLSNLSAEECKKRILIIGDSFNWAVSSYLATGVEEITVIHNASFGGSILSMIDEYHPDAVIMVYNDAEFYNVYTEDAFDLK